MPLASPQQAPYDDVLLVDDSGVIYYLDQMTLRVFYMELKTKVFSTKWKDPRRKNKYGTSIVMTCYGYTS
jgi:hypothetical protein